MYLLRAKASPQTWTFQPVVLHTGTIGGRHWDLWFCSFGVHCSSQIVCFKTFGFWYSLKTLLGFWIWYPIGFFDFSYLGHSCTTIMILNSCELDRLKFWSQGCENLSVLMVLHAVFGLENLQNKVSVFWTDGGHETVLKSTHLS